MANCLLLYTPALVEFAQSTFHLLSVEINSQLLWLCIQANTSDWFNKLRATFSTNQKLNQTRSNAFSRPLQKEIKHVAALRFEWVHFLCLLQTVQSYVFDFKRNTNACTGNFGFIDFTTLYQNLTKRIL